MPIVYQKDFQKGSLAVWEIRESYSELLDLACLNGDEITKLITYKSEGRKLEWLCSRVLIKTLISEPQSINILYDHSGKPYIQGSSIKISISHSKNFVAVIFHETHEVGIDVEIIPLDDNKEWKVETIAHKFICNEELAFLNDSTKKEQLLIMWGAKECLYKLNLQPELLFKEDICIDAFKYTLPGELTATVKKDNFAQTFKLFFERIEGCSLVYVINN